MHSSYTAAYRREPAWMGQPSPLRAMAARPRMFLLVTLAMFVLFAVLILTLPKGYVSEMKLRMGSEDERSVPNIAGAGATRVTGTDNLDGRMNLDVEVLQSADALTEVVLKTGLQKLEVAENRGTGETSRLTVGKAVQRLQENLRVERVGKSNVVDVSYSGPSEELATATLEALAAVYPKARLKVYGEPGNYNFLQRQSAVWRVQMGEAENDLVHFRRRYSEFVLPEERDALGKRTVEAQAAFEQADAQVAQYKRKVAEAREKLKAMSPAKAEQSRAILKNDAVGRALLTLVDLVGRRADVEDSAPANRKVAQEADERVRNAKATLSRTLAQVSAETARDSNPVHQNAEINLIASETELAGLQALRDRLKQTAESYKAQMFRLADAAVRDSALLRQVKQSEEQYLLYCKWQEQVVAAQGIAKEDIFGFGVVQRPTIPMEPSTPHVGIDLWLSFLLSACCGLAAVLCAEYLTPSALLRYGALRTISAEFEAV